MRTVSATLEAEIERRFASESILVVEIVWSVDEDTGEESLSQYAEKDKGDYKGIILDVSDIKTVTRIENTESFQVAVTLDDTSGEIKEHLDNKNLHKRPCRIYQAYEDVSDERFLLVEGVISTPFEWNNLAKSITFNVTHNVESFEVGFSPEESQLAFVPDEAVGKNWPLAFGHVVHVPATKITQQEQAKLLERLCIPDAMLYAKLDNLDQQFQQAAAQFALHSIMASVAHKLAPPVWWVLEQYVLAIIAEDMVVLRIFLAQRNGVNLKKRAQVDPNDVVVRNNLAVLNQQLQLLARLGARVQARKKWLEEQIEKIKFAWNVIKQQISKALAAYDQARQFQLEALKVEMEICRQLSCYRACVKVDNAEDTGFPELVPVDVCISGLRFRVVFDHSTRQMCILAGPISQYFCLEVDDWQPDPDDEACASGINMFWLKDEPPVNISGMWARVASKGDTCAHIIKINSQKGRRVFFDLTEYEFHGSGGSPRGLSLDTVINEIVEMPLVPGPRGNPVPADFFNGRLNPLVWNRPEARLFLQIVALIPGPLSKEEKRNLALLVFMLKMDAGAGVIGDLTAPSRESIYTIVGREVDKVLEAGGAPQSHWVDWKRGECPPREEVPDSFAWEAGSGSDITTCEERCVLYIANLLPSTIKAVYAYRETDNNGRIFTPVPSSYYVKNEAAPLGTYTVTALTFVSNLKDIPGEGWEDNIYVTMNSSVGPSVVDIIQWLLETYTNVPVNASNFAEIKAKVANYPANFALLQRPNVLQEVQRICWEARLGIVLTSGEWKLFYLSEEKDSDDQLSENDMDVENGLTVVYTSTDDIITRMIATFDKTYKPLEDGEQQDRVILRHNVKQYGLHTGNEHFHIYNDWGLVEKSATFWLIRKANSWKKVKVEAPITKIRSELFDTMLLATEENFVGVQQVKCQVDEVTYGTNNNSIRFTLHTGIRSGEIEQYEHFWPALGTGQFPTEIEIGEGYAGGEGPAAGVAGTINDCPPATEESVEEGAGFSEGFSKGFSEGFG